MTISQVYTFGLPKVIAKKLLEKVGIQLEPTEYGLPESYEQETGKEHYRRMCRLEPNSLVLGLNSDHHGATFLSEFPIVVIDNHSDMYRHDEGRITHYNWVYWKLKFGGCVHLVLPAPSSETFIASEPELLERLHIYDIFGFRRRSARITGQRISTQWKVVQDLDELYNRLKGLPKQVSLDLDVLCHAREERFVRPRVRKILENLLVDGNIHDIWLDNRLGNLSSRELEEARYFLNVIK